jgi:dihydroorotate dehydrogenase (fumarate)
VLPTHPKSRPGSRTLLGLVAAVLALAFTLGLTAAPAFADQTDGISGGPADERTRLSYQMKPGQRLDDEYVVRNTGSTPQTVTLFATDAFNTDDGQYALLDTARKPTGVGTWIIFNGADKVEHIALAPGQQKTVPFTVNVPANAGPGDHAGGIVVSNQVGSGQILVDRRVATRLYVRVPGKLQPQLTIASLHATYDPSWNPLDGRTTLTFTIRNGGNVSLGAHLVAGANTFFGIGTGGEVRKDVLEMLPGSTRTMSVVVTGVPQVGYLDPHVSLQPTVDKDALNPGPLHVVSRDTVIVAVPWWLLVVALLVGGFFLVRWLRRRGDGKRAAEWVAYTEAEARRKAREEQEDAVGAAAGRTGSGSDHDKA